MCTAGTTKTRDQLRKLFHETDTDGNGALGIDEVRALGDKLGMVMNEEELQRAMREMDKDGSGEVDFDEFTAWSKLEGKNSELIAEPETLKPTALRRRAIAAKATDQEVIAAENSSDPAALVNLIRSKEKTDLGVGKTSKCCRCRGGYESSMGGLPQSHSDYITVNDLLAKPHQHDAIIVLILQYEQRLWKDNSELIHQLATLSVTERRMRAIDAVSKVVGDRRAKELVEAAEDGVSPLRQFAGPSALTPRSKLRKGVAMITHGRHVQTHKNVGAGVGDGAVGGE